MTAEVVSIGTELLLGQIVDTNAAYLAGRLSALGVSVYHRATVGDNRERAIQTVRTALSRADAVFLIGGLGPTMDDLTRDVIADVLDAPLVRDEAVAAHLADWFARRNYPLTEVLLRQADVPTGGEPLANPNGTAPGLFVEKNGKIIVALPGPPGEFIPLFENEVAPRLAARTGSVRQVIRSRTVRVVGMGESNAEALLRDLMESANPTVAPYAKTAEVHLRVTARAETDADADRQTRQWADIIRERLGSVVYGEDDTNLESAVVGLLRDKRQTVATAESCTGGLLAGRITSVAGSSDVFGTGLVTYSNETKTRLLQIPPSLIGGVGAVSPEVAQAMASRVRELAGSGYGVGITGIAGPGGGSDEKPVGLVYIGLATPSGDVAVRKNLFSGLRDDIRFRATQAALAWLRESLLEM